MRHETAQIIDGLAIAKTIRGEIAAELAALKPQAEQRDIPSVPGLAVVIVGDRRDSRTYVKLKHQAALNAGFDSHIVQLPDTATQAEVLAVVAQLNEDPAVHGILVQLPLPAAMNEAEVIEAVRPDKDVDGLHPMNIGLTHSRRKAPMFSPCTALGVVELLKRSGVEITGKHTAVLGRSPVIGMPVANMLQRENATVTVCHRRSENVVDIVRTSDIVVACCGKPHLVRDDWLKPGAAVIDVGTNPVDDPSKPNGYRLVGDVHFESAKNRVGLITPVPGGVGPMTITMLLSNTLTAFKRTLLRPR